MDDALAERRPLGGLVADAARLCGSVATVMITEHPFEHLMVLRLDDADDATLVTLANASGLDLTGGGRAVTANETTALWLGPGNWLLKRECERRGVPAFHAAITSLPCVSIDVSDAWFGVRVQGPRANDLLAKGCALDLDGRRFIDEACAVTQFARVAALIHRVDASPAYDIRVERSYAAYLWSWLMDAMVEFVDP